MNRKLIARLVLVAAVLVIGGQLFGAVPREVEIRYDLGPDHRSISEARIAYLMDGEEVKGVEFRYVYGAPAVVTHRLELAPGRYAVHAVLRGEDVERQIERTFEVPTEGLIRIELFDEALARLGREGEYACRLR